MPRLQTPHGYNLEGSFFAAKIKGIAPETPNGFVPNRVESKKLNVSRLDLFFESKRPANTSPLGLIRRILLCSKNRRYNFWPSWIQPVGFFGVGSKFLDFFGILQYTRGS